MMRILNILLTGLIFGWGLTAMISANAALDSVHEAAAAKQMADARARAKAKRAENIGKKYQYLGKLNTGSPTTGILNMSFKEYAKKKIDEGMTDAQIHQHLAPTVKNMIDARRRTQNQNLETRNKRITADIMKRRAQDKIRVACASGTMTIDSVECSKALASNPSLLASLKQNAAQHLVQFNNLKWLEERLKLLEFITKPLPQPKPTCNTGIFTESRTQPSTGICYNGHSWIPTWHGISQRTRTVTLVNNQCKTSYSLWRVTRQPQGKCSGHGGGSPG